MSPVDQSSLGGLTESYSWNGGVTPIRIWRPHIIDRIAWLAMNSAGKSYDAMLLDAKLSCAVGIFSCPRPASNLPSPHTATFWLHEFDPSAPQCASSDVERRVLFSPSCHRYSTRPCIVEVVNYDRRTQVTTVDIIIREGKNRQIRRMFEGIGHEVKSITRVSHGPIRIKNLRPGEWRELEQVGLALL